MPDTPNLPVPVETLPALRPVAERVADLFRQAKAASTWRAYKTDWSEFDKWCAEQDPPLCPFPATAEVLVAYLVAPDVQLKVASMQRRLAALACRHELKGYPSPTADPLVKLAWAGWRRQNGEPPVRKAALRTEDLLAGLERFPGNLLGMRDRALLLIGFAGAFRRSEVVALDRTDLDFRPEGLVIVVKRSKTDQEGHGRTVGIPLGRTPESCPVRALQGWLDAAGISDGAIFRPVNRHGRIGIKRLSDRAVALVVKRCARAAGLDESLLAGHSLRSGLATAAARNGASERAIMKQTGHRSTAMLRIYIHNAELFLDNAAGVAGL